MGMKAFFASEMRRVREELGMTVKQVAEVIGTYKEPSLRGFENGFRTPTVALAAGLDKAYGTHGMFQAMQRQAELDGTPFGDLKESEQRATAIRIWDMRGVPGMLQHPRYAMALLGDEASVDTRIERQKIFSRAHPPHVHVILSEGVLYAEYGGASVLREQLEHLIRPDARWTLQVLPDVRASPSGVDGPLTLLEFDGDESSIAFLDSRNSGTVVDDASQVSALWQEWECLTSEALPAGMSREMIRDVIRELPEG